MDKSMIGYWALVAFSYFVSAIPFSLLVAKVHGVDLRAVGSGNLGATNVKRALGIKWAVVVFLLDGGKGFLSVFLAMHFFPSLVLFHVMIGFFCIFAHSLSVFVKFKGGKGAATGLGVLCALSLPTFLVVFLSGVLVIYLTRIVSVGTIVGCLMIPPVLWWVGAPMTYIVGMSIAVGFVMYRHKDNIARLISGKENLL